MRLLIITQKVDNEDDLLGFFHSWILEFAKNCQQITVICLQKGQFNLSSNVKVLSLGKEQGRSVVKYIVRFYKYIWQERREYDAVFVHMNIEYVLLGGLPWRLMNKKIALWYLHKAADWKLRIAVWLAQIIFTASPESFRLKSNKIKIVGHGINTAAFKKTGSERSGNNFKILYVGRISAIKNQALLIEAANILLNQKKKVNFKIELIGSAVYRQDDEYSDELKRRINDYRLAEHVVFIGSVPNKEIAKYYQSADLTINLCPTGGMDKAVLESMAAGVPVIALNKTFIDVFGKYSEELILKEPKAEDLAEKIISQMQAGLEKRASMSEDLTKIVEDNFNLAKLVKKIIEEYQKNA